MSVLFPSYYLLLRGMARVGTFYHFSLSCIAVEDITLPKVVSHHEGIYCSIVFAPFVTFRLISVLYELHIAVYCLGTACRSPRVIHFFARSMNCLWCVGLVVGIVESVLGRFLYDGMTCEPAAPLTITTAVFATCGAVPLIAYLVALFQSQVSAPEVVHRRRSRQLSMYPFNFIRTHGPALLLYTGYFSWTSDGIVFFVILMCSLNGLVNVSTYALQSRYRRVLHYAADTSTAFDLVERDRHGPSFDVAFGDVSYLSRLLGSVRNTWTSSGLSWCTSFIGGKARITGAGDRLDAQ